MAGNDLVIVQASKQGVAERRDWPDLEYTAVYRPKGEYDDVVAKFQVYAHEGYTESVSGQFDVPMFWRKGASSSMDGVSDPDKAEVLLEVSIKWDGCSQWDLQENMHICESEGVEKFGEMMKRVYAFARDLGMDRL